MTLNEMSLIYVLGGAEEKAAFTLQEKNADKCLLCIKMHIYKNIYIHFLATYLKQQKIVVTLRETVVMCGT